jgi:salicylate hydroxylase
VRPPPHVAASVIGAGLAGLTAALALQRSGLRVRVFEQAPVLGEVGAGLTLSPGAAKALASLGLGPAVLAASSPIPDIAFVHWATGERLAGRIETGDPPDAGLASPRHIHRADLHAILVAAVREMDPDALVLGRRLVGLELAADRVEAHFDDGTIARAGILIGADGARSAVRRQLIDASPPQFAGQVAFRALIPGEAAQPWMGAGNAAVFVGPSRVFNRYRLRRGALVNVVGIARCDRWPVEGWNTPATAEEVREVFAGFHPDVMGLVGQATAGTLIKWGLFVRPPVAAWSVGRVVLVGDAAHPILPFLGLGAALAIEDGVVLARALRATPDPAAAFAAFQRARLDRVEAVRSQSIRQGRILQTGEPDANEIGASPSQDATLFGYDPCDAPLGV